MIGKPIIQLKKKSSAISMNFTVYLVERKFLALIRAWEMLNPTVQDVITRKIWHLGRSKKHFCLSQVKKIVLFKTKLHEPKLLSQTF